MRIFPVVSLALLSSIVLCGCGPAFKGTLNEGSGSPQPASGQPDVTGVNPASVVAGGPGFFLTVTGQNFAPGDSVQWNHVPLASTFVSSTQMTATVPSALLNDPGAPTIASVIVQTPVPYSLNFGSNVSITAPSAPGSAGFTLATVNVQANDMVWDPKSQRIYLSIAGSNAAHPNTITAVDPTTLQFGNSISAGPGANRIALSSDSSWLYAGIDTNGTVQRYSLPGLIPEITISLGTGTGSLRNSAFDIEPDPVAPNTIAVSQYASVSQPGTVIIYDGATPRPASVTGVDGQLGPLWSLCWNNDGTKLFSAFSAQATQPVDVFSVISTGVQLIQSSRPASMGAIHYSALTGDVYGNYGLIYNPSTNDLSNRLPISVLGVFSGLTTPLAIDDSLGLAWIVFQTVSNQSSQKTIAAFDLKTNALLGSIEVSNVTGTPTKLIRWGTNGLAFLTQDPSAPLQGDGVYIVSGAFVTTPSVQ
jgi:hypothetical protein